MSTSVSLFSGFFTETEKFNETDVDTCFTLFWNGSRHLFSFFFYRCHYDACEANEAL